MMKVVAKATEVQGLSFEEVAVAREDLGAIVVFA
jgi:hypothetical protein